MGAPFTETLMPVRVLIAYLLILVLALGAAAVLWHLRRKRLQRRAIRRGRASRYP